jgi:cation diffusion facilitator family transporter
MVAEHIDEDDLKQKVQRWIVSISVLILIGKFAAFYITNSAAILTDAMESIVNVTAGFISLYSLHWAAKPKDKSHPFGHGKIELVSASVEGLLIGIAGVVIIYEGVYRLFVPVELQKLDTGIVVVAVAGVVNYLMGWFSIRIGKKYKSIALEAGGRHLQSDTYSTIGLVLGLLVVYFTGLRWVDSLLAVIFGVIILVTGISILRRTIASLLDKADYMLLKRMAKTINANRREDWIDIHNAKIISYGSWLYIDCDLTQPWYYNIIESNSACDRLKDVLVSEFSDKIQLSIHSDPCKPADCQYCKMQDCPYRNVGFEELEEFTLLNMTECDEERAYRN